MPCNCDTGMRSGGYDHDHGCVQFDPLVNASHLLQFAERLKRRVFEQEPLGPERRPFVWTPSALGLLPNGEYYGYLTPAKGVTVRISGHDQRALVRLANAIEAMEVRS